MSTSRFEYGSVLATAVQVTDETLSVDLSDGRTILAPIVWFPRLLQGTAQERAKWEFNGGGTGIHWPDLDEDISVEGLLFGVAATDPITAVVVIACLASVGLLATIIPSWRATRIDPVVILRRG